MKKYRKSPVGNIVSTGVTNLVGIGMIDASSKMVNALPAGTAKTVAGVVPGLQSVALLGPNLKLVKKSFPKWKKGRY